MADDDNAQTHQQAPEPNPALESLDVMVGTWELKGRESGSDGEICGQPTFEWMEVGFYLVQYVDIDYIGRRTMGTEYTGYDQENDNLMSYFFSNEGPGPFGQVALEYVWEVGDDTFTVWGGEVGSPASFKDRFGDDRNTTSGCWEWPGGGYQATMTRVDHSNRMRFRERATAIGRRATGCPSPRQGAQHRVRTRGRGDVGL